MNRNDSMKKLAMVVGATFSAAAAMPASAQADGADAFALQDLGTDGYSVMARADVEGKCGEGKCGGSDAKASAEGKCGGSDSKASAEGKCGEGKCGGADAKASAEGKCGDSDSKAATEGKCGEGKCGGA
jgi:uncharacterized low-complexity protein